jgi:ribosomal protein S18 acetylase RimI-like enzyme
MDQKASGTSQEAFVMIEILSPDHLPDILPALRQVQQTHVDARPDIFAPYGADADYLAFFRTAMTEKGLTVLVWRDAGRCVGFLSYEIEERDANPFLNQNRQGYLHHISVLDSHRRQGIGRALVQAMQAALVKEGVTMWKVTYWRFNAASAALMRSAGAQEVHVRAEGYITA